MRMREIEVVCALMNYKNFYEAGTELSFTPSAISKYVSSVEKALGVELFVRSKKSKQLRLTAEGEALMPALERINNDFAYLIKITEQLKEEGNGNLRIGAMPRLGNIVEQEILSRFMTKHSEIKIQVVKDTSQELLFALENGNVDAVFAVLLSSMAAEEYFCNQRSRDDFDLIHVATEDSIYLGIEDKYFPAKSEAPFRSFQDFVFALPIPETDDPHDQNAIAEYKLFAEKEGFKLKYMNFSAHDSTIFRLVPHSRIAVCTTNIPPQHDGIKFMRITDWPGSTRLYLIYRKSNRSRSLNKFLKEVRAYRVNEDKPG